MVAYVRVNESGDVVILIGSHASDPCATFGAKVVTHASEYSEIHSPPGTYTNHYMYSLRDTPKRCIRFFTRK